MRVVGKADLLSDHFERKLSREFVDHPLTYHLSPSLNSFAFWSKVVRRLLLDLDPCDGTDLWGRFLVFLIKRTDVLVHVLV